MKGVILDTNTTGLDHRRDEIIETGVIAFTFDEHAAIGNITGLYSGLQQPGCTILVEIAKITGITDEMVASQMIDMARLRSLVEPVDLIIAHNAGFDRPFCESLSPVFSGKAWACSHGNRLGVARLRGHRLGYVIGQAGFFHDGHRAVDDCSRCWRFSINKLKGIASIGFEPDAIVHGQSSARPCIRCLAN